MRQLKLAGLTVHVHGGRDREGAGDGPLVVLMHGFGAPGTDLVPLWRQIRAPTDVRFAFPEAPIELDFGIGVSSRAWWQIDLEKLTRAVQSGRARELVHDEPPGLAAAREQVTTLLTELERELDARPEQLVLGGFSQGAMLATDLALRTARPLAGLVVLSGTLFALDAWRPLLPARQGLKVLQSHGRSDPILPFELAELLRDELEAAGLDVTFLSFAGGHGIPDGVVERLGRFIEDATRRGP